MSAESRCVLMGPTYPSCLHRALTSISTTPMLPSGLRLHLAPVPKLCFCSTWPNHHDEALYPPRADAPDSSSCPALYTARGGGGRRRRPEVLGPQPSAVKLPRPRALTGVERAALAVGSGPDILLQPEARRHDRGIRRGHGDPYFIYRLRDAMLASATGRRILRDRPRMTAASLDLDRLRALPANTVGRTYVAWLDREGVSPDTRAAVRYVSDPECAYVLQRYRESHDFYHALTGLPTVREGEVALKAFEFANTLLPMTGLSVLAAATLKPSERRRFVTTYLPWAVRNGLRAGRGHQRILGGGDGERRRRAARPARGRAAAGPEGYPEEGEGGEEADERGGDGGSVAGVEHCKSLEQF